MNKAMGLRVHNTIWYVWDINPFIFGCRGKDILTDFAHIGKICSLISIKTNLMALTAMANLIIHSLKMNQCYIKAQNLN